MVPFMAEPAPDGGYDGNQRASNTPDINLRLSLRKTGNIVVDRFERYPEIGWQPLSFLVIR